MLIDALSKNLHVFVRNFVQLDIDLSKVLAHIPNKWIDDRDYRENDWSLENDYLRELYLETNCINVSDFIFFENFTLRKKFIFDVAGSLLFIG
jgi:hypothetical protein